MSDYDPTTGKTSPAANSEGNDANSAQSAMRGIKENVAEQINQAKASTQEQVTSAITSNKERAAEEIHGFAEALRQTSQQLRDQDMGAVAQYADQIGEQIEQVSRYLREKDVQGLISDVEDFARRNPAVFVGAALGLGLLSARFLKSSSHHTHGLRNELGTYETGTSYAGDTARDRSSTYPGQSGLATTEER